MVMISRCSLARSSIAAASCVELADVGAEPVRAAAAGILNLVAQTDLARGRELAAQLADLEFALGQQTVLLAKPRFQLLHAAAEQLRFGRLRHKLPLEFAGVRGELVELAAGFVQLVGRRLGVAALAREAVFGRPHGALVIGDAELHRFDLGAYRSELDALAVGQDRALAELGDEFGKLRLLVGERALGFAQRARFERKLVLGGAQLFAQMLFARFQRRDRGRLLGELFLELVDGVGLLAEFGKL